MNGTEAATLFQHPDRNLAMELVRATEAAAIRAVPFIGRGDKNTTDKAAVGHTGRHEERIVTADHVLDLRQLVDVEPGRLTTGTLSVAR